MSERRLAAIVAVDVVGYSRLVRLDELGTIDRLRRLRFELVEPLVAQESGRIVKLMGDGVLLEFSSVVSAVRVSLALQEALAQQEAEQEDDKAIRLRIGVNLGDVVVDGQDIQGDGVNIAARLESVAEPGSIALAGKVFEEVRDRIEARYEDLGEQSLKNIDRPVQVWACWPSASAKQASNKEMPGKDKPSIAVLPFDNLSGVDDQEHLADGLTEDIITALSKFRWFHVTARNSTFTYKGKAVDVTQVGRDLAVEYVLEGSWRQVGDRVRVTAQLIEAASGNHVWAERYDRRTVDIFDLQDEMTSTIAAAVEPELASSTYERAKRKPTEDLRAWEYFHRGVNALWRYQPEACKEAQDNFRQAIALDNDYAQPWAYLGVSYYQSYIMGWVDNGEAALASGLQAVEAALKRDPRDYTAHFAKGRLYTPSGDIDQAIASLKTALSINPNFAHGYFALGGAYCWAGRGDEARENILHAIRLSPNDSNVWVFYNSLGVAELLRDDPQAAIEGLEKGLHFANVGFWLHMHLAMARFRNGEMEAALAAMEKARVVEPALSIALIKKQLRYAKLPKVLDYYFPTLQELGLD